MPVTERRPVPASSTRVGTSPPSGTTATQDGVAAVADELRAGRGRRAAHAEQDQPHARTVVARRGQCRRSSRSVARRCGQLGAGRAGDGLQEGPAVHVPQPGTRRRPGRSPSWARPAAGRSRRSRRRAELHPVGPGRRRSPRGGRPRRRSTGRPARPAAPRRCPAGDVERDRLLGQPLQRRVRPARPGSRRRAAGRSPAGRNTADRSSRSSAGIASRATAARQSAQHRVRPARSDRADQQRHDGRAHRETGRAARTRERRAPGRPASRRPRAGAG